MSDIGRWPGKHPSSVCEQAVIGTLRVARTELGTPWRARRAVEWALAEWRLGRFAGPELLANDWHDIDARLAFVRWAMLERLSRLAPADAPTLGALHALGDTTPAGWVVAVRAALADATGVAREAARHRPPRRDVEITTLRRALAAFAEDDDAFAPLPRRIVFPTAGGALDLAVPTEWSTANARADLTRDRLAVSYRAPDGTRQDRLTLGPDHWRACNAMFAGMLAVDCLALPEERAALARGRLRRGIVQLLGHGRTPARSIVGALASGLDDASHPGAVRRKASSDDWAWPSAFAVVMGALDRFAGAGREPVSADVPIGTWVEVVDPARGHVRGVGAVADPSDAPVLRGTPAQRRRVLRNMVAVRVDGDVQRWPVAAVRTAPRVQLFSGSTD